MRTRRISLALGVTTLLLLIFGSAAIAAPITVNLRVEGSTETLFEGPITTDAQTIEAPAYETEGPSEPHPCDVNENGEYPLGSNGASYGNPTTALYDAAQELGLTFHAYWYEPLHDFFVEGIGELGPKGTEAWEYAVNYTTANVGGCQFQLAPGSEVLWAANFGLAKHLLNLSGPTSVIAGVPFTVHVTDGQTGQPVGGASIGEDVSGVTTTISGSPNTNANGDVTITLTHTGTIELKATQPESVRSNGLSVTVNPPGVPTCACAPPVSLQTKTHEPNTTDSVTAQGITSDHTYSRRKSPRVLAGVIGVPANGTLRQVRISLKRRRGRHCFDFSGTREKFVHLKCGRPAKFFSVGSSESFSYLLPSQLPAGRYVYEIEAVNDAGQTTALVNGVSHVAFTVK